MAQIKNWKKLTDQDVLDLILSGRYIIDFENVKIYGPRGLISLRYDSGRNDRVSICLTYKFCRVKMVLHKFLWMAYHKKLVPVGHEIHHGKMDRYHFHIDTLECLTREEHRRRHSQDVEDFEPIPQ